MPMNKKSSLNLSLEEAEKAALRELAEIFGVFWGGQPNISELVKAIAAGKLKLEASDWSDRRVEILDRILEKLKSSGQREEAEHLALLLLERSEVSAPKREAIQGWIERPQAAWREAMDLYIREHQPFRVAYSNPMEDIEIFTVRHEEVARREGQEYLDCWCEETAGNPEPSPLHHNWALLLERLPEDTEIIPLGGNWREPEYLEVEFHLYGAAALEYQPDRADRIDADLKPAGRRIVRRERSIRQLFPALRRYGAECILVGPAEVRDRFGKEIKQLAEKY